MYAHANLIENERSPFPLSGLLFRDSELLDATEQKSKDNLLGRGGYGCVYKGVIHHTTVAVKFLNEVSSVKSCCKLHMIDIIFIV